MDLTRSLLSYSFQCLHHCDRKVKLITGKRRKYRKGYKQETDSNVLYKLQQASVLMVGSILSVYFNNKSMKPCLKTNVLLKSIAYLNTNVCYCDIHTVFKVVSLGLTKWGHSCLQQNTDKVQKAVKSKSRDYQLFNRLVWVPCAYVCIVKI